MGLQIIKSLAKGEPLSWVSWVTLAPITGILIGVLFLATGGSDATVGSSLLSTVIQVLIMPWIPLAIYVWFTGASGAKEGHVRGAALMDKSTYRNFEKSMDDATKAHAVYIGGVPIPPDLEPLSFLISGSPGTGKSQIIRGILSQLRGRDDIVIVADPGGDMMKIFLNEKADTILNPLDSRSSKWSILAELENEWEASRLAKAIVPDGEGSNLEWTGYAQSLITSVIQSLPDGAKNGDLLDALTISSDEQLGRLVAGTPAARLFSKGSEKMLGSIRSIIATELTPWTYLDRDASSKDWSISKFIRQAVADQVATNDDLESSVPWLWIPYKSDQRALLRPLLGAWLDLISTTVMKLDPSSDRRIWVIVDELPALRKVGSLTESLAEGRKFGLVCVAGLQNISQLREVYGRDGAQSLLGCFQNVVTLRITDTDTAEYMSEKLGEGEFEEERTSKTQSDGNDSKTTSLYREKKRIVMPAEIKSLPNLRGYLDIAGPIPPMLIEVPIVEAETVAEAFIPRPKTEKRAWDAAPPSDSKPAKKIDLDL